MSEGVVDVGALYTSLDAKRQAEHLSWRGLAQLLGVAPSTFTRMAQGRRPDVDTFAALLRWLDQPVDAFMTPQESGDVKEEASVEKIGTFLRMDRNLTPEAARALEAAIRLLYDQMRIQPGN